MEFSRNINKNAKVLTEDNLRVLTPSVFTSEASHKVSGSYSLIPTIETVRGLQKAGFEPVWAQESKCRNSENKPYSKHMIRFRQQGVVDVGGMFPEIVLLNSHDGSSSYQLKAGLFRLVCSNGLIVGDELFHRRVMHKGNVVDKVIEGAQEIIDIVPEVVDVANEWRGIKLTPEASIAYAESAKLLKWDESDGVNAQSLLRPRRYDDTQANLWTAFNVIQENLIRGGVRMRKANEAGIVRRNTSRAVNSVTENSRLNTALWNLTSKMAELVKN